MRQGASSLAFLGRGLITASRPRAPFVRFVQNRNSAALRPSYGHSHTDAACHKRTVRFVTALRDYMVEIGWLPGSDRVEASHTPDV